MINTTKEPGVPAIQLGTSGKVSLIQRQWMPIELSEYHYIAIKGITLISHDQDGHHRRCGRVHAGSKVVRHMKCFTI